MLFIIVIHFLADFALQTNEQANKKSTDLNYLAYHCLTYTLIWLLVGISLGFSLGQVWFFCVITFLAHFITDYATSRIGKPFWDKQDYHNGFVVIGIDQVLHYFQLFYTYELIKTLI
jgi:putative Mn2+ efflux pump MntP